MEVLTNITHYLISQSWQIALLVVAIAMVSFFLKNKSAHARYLLWLIVLVKCLVPPLLTVPVAILPEERAIPSLGQLAQEPEELDLRMQAAGPLGEPLPEPTDVVSIEPRDILPPQPVPRRMLSWPEWVALVWAVGVASYILITLVQVCWSHAWLGRRRKLATSELNGIVAEICAKMNMKACPKVWLVDGIAQPFVWGWVRGEVYLPGDFAEMESKEHQRDVLGHELSHVLRFDAAINILQVLAQAIFWFHPLVWWANYRIRTEREKCCDEMAIAHLEVTPKPYGRAIVEVLLSEHRLRRPLPSLAVAGPLKNVEERIKTMMRPGKKFYKRPSLIAAIIVLVFAMVSVPTALVLTARAQAETEQGGARYASLYEAAEVGDLAEVKRYITEGADVNATHGEDRRTPLGVAAAGGHVEIVKVLLDKGAEVDKVDARRYSALWWAAFEYHEETIRVLISRGADVNLVPEKYDMPICYAIWGRKPGIVKAFLDAGANLELMIDKDGKSPLQYAIKECDPDIVKLLADTDDRVPVLHRAALKGELSKLKELLGATADINDKDAFGRTPVEYALAAGQIDAFKLLLDQGVDVNLATKWNNRSLLDVAATEGLLDIVQILIAKGASLNTNSSELFHAILHGHAAVVGLLIDNGADINASDSRGHTPLEIAIKEGHSDVIDLLRQRNAKETLYAAVASGNVDAVKRLISEGANVNEQKRFSSPGRSFITDTLLHLACQKANKEIVELLINNGADMNVFCIDKTPLHLAFKSGRKDIVGLLISKGADVNEKKVYSTPLTTPLHLSVELGSTDIVSSLIAKGADVNAKKIYDVTPLHMAAEKGSVDIAALLLAKGADVNAKKSDDMTPLHVAAQKGSAEMIDLLIAKGADVNTANAGGYTALDIAGQKRFIGIISILRQHGAKETLFGVIALGDIEQLKRMLSEGADVNCKNKNGATPLHSATLSGPTNMVELLVSKGADVNAKDRQGTSPLHNAVIAGHKDIVELLISKGADVNAKGEYSCAPLHHAALYGHKDVVELLISKGANVDANDKWGTTALSRAEEMNRTEIVELLKKHGAKKAPLTLLEVVTSGGVEQARLLISQGADVNAKNSRGMSLLHIAVARGNKDLVELLIVKGADVNTKDQNGQMPLQWALNRNRMDVAELLVANGADVNAIDGQTGKALLLSVGGRKERIEFLLSKGANIEARDENGLTLLHLQACYSNQKDYLDIVKLALDKGAHIESRSYGDSTPLQGVVAVGRTEAAELLLARGAKLNVISKFYGTPAHQAMMQKRPEMVRWCIAKGIEIPPLHQACYFGDAEKVRSLLVDGADVNQKDVAQFTPLHCAMLAGR